VFRLSSGLQMHASRELEICEGAICFVRIGSGSWDSITIALREQSTQGGWGFDLP
jgi:hypothetical protein